MRRIALTFGGKRGCLYPGSGADAEALLESAKKLTPGAVSDVIETPRALVLLRLDGKLAAASTEREGRRQIARTLYLASSDVADIATGTLRLASALRAASPPALTWRYEPHPQLTHATIFRALEAHALAAALR